MKTVREVAAVLERHGSRFAGNNADDEAQGWLDNEFDADEVDEWCEVGCWDADTAASLRGAGLTPKQADEACDRLVEEEQAEWNAADEAAAEADPVNWTPCVQDSKYTYDPMYSVCNGDTNVDVLAAKATK